MPRTTGPLAAERPVHAAHAVLHRCRGMNDPGSGYQQLFSQAVATRRNRTRFVRAALRFCRKYQFDGVYVSDQVCHDGCKGPRLHTLPHSLTGCTVHPNTLTCFSHLPCAPLPWLPCRPGHRLGDALGIYFQSC